MSVKLQAMKFVSLIIALAYVLLGVAISESLTAAVGHALFVAAIVVLPLACIWFGDEVGDYVGVLPGPSINRRTPGVFIKVGGWALLLLPIAAYWLTKP